tara:strand:- start:1116 stop:2480 length:1365 start_codon:yes stop_codon:yes gene_type:complete
MIQTKQKLYVYLFIISLIFVFLDAYKILEIPLSWIGLSLLIIPGINEFKIIFQEKFLKYGFLSILLLSVPDIFNFFGNNFLNIDYQYIFLRYFNLISFFIVLIFSYNFFQKNSSDLFLALIRKFIVTFSVITIYIYIAQIFDLYEPIRNRQNTDLFEEINQSIFWLSQPHRAMGTFREPVLLITFFFPIVLIYLYLKKDQRYLIPILSGVAIGLTRSDYAKVYCLFLLVYIFSSFLLNKEFLFGMSIFVITVLFFSTFGILECNVNPESKECKEYPEDVAKINGSGNFRVITNASTPTSELDNDRILVLNYFYSSLSEIKATGLSEVNKNYQEFLTNQINSEMYFLNRTLPSFLLQRYSTQSFGTGSYSVTKYVPNVQNVIVFYSIGFGYTFLAIIFLLITYLFHKKGANLNVFFFLGLILMLCLSPIEEVNSFYGLILGFIYVKIFRKDYEQI